jgi:hypothetical protein
MARSYLNYKQNLNEQEQKLLEIGQLVKPYHTDFNFDESGHNISTMFKDDQENTIEIQFYRLDKNSNGFEIDFMINGNSVEAFKTSTKHFFKIISTVAHAINKFIETFQPTQLFIDALNKPGKENQKNKIWLQYVKVNLKADYYAIGNQGNGFTIQKKQ